MTNRIATNGQGPESYFMEIRTKRGLMQHFNNWLVTNSMIVNY